MKDLKEFVSSHFDTLALLFIFVFATFMLAFFKNEEMARWIENGAIVTIIARSMGINKPAAPQPSAPPASDPAPNPSPNKEN